MSAQRMKEILGYIDTEIELGNKVTVQQIMEDFGISSTWLLKLFRNQLQITPHQYISQKEYSYVEKTFLSKRKLLMKQIIPDISFSRRTLYRRIQKFGNKYPNGQPNRG
jgi:AraC-like DNA-binding protein